MDKACMEYCQRTTHTVVCYISIRSRSDSIGRFTSPRLGATEYEKVTTNDIMDWTKHAFEIVFNKIV